MFKKLMGNAEIKLLYTVIVSKFEEEVAHYFQMRDRAIAQFGKRFELSDEYLHIDEDGDGFYESGLGIPDEEISFLKKELSKPSHNILNQFRLSQDELTVALR